MDNRLKFLYCNITELWGHREKARAGNGNAGASEVEVMEENPHCNSKA